MPKLIKPDGSTAAITSPGQIECIKLYEDMLAAAKAGEITSTIVIACGPIEFGSAMAGSDAARLNLGLDTAKAMILNRTTMGGGGGRSVLHR